MARTRLYLDEAIHGQLRDLACQQSPTVSELVREALVRPYGPIDAPTRHAAAMAALGYGRTETTSPTRAST